MPQQGPKGTSSQQFILQKPWPAKHLFGEQAPPSGVCKPSSPQNTRFAGFEVARAVADTRWHMACHELAACGDGWNSLAVGIITLHACSMQQLVS